MSAWIAGVGLWAPGYAGASAWLAGTPDPAVQKPACSIVDSRLLRATSTVTRVSIEAAAQALADSSLDARETPTVFGSWHGEIVIAIEQIDVVRRGDGLVSPARFRNSVHNTASGVLSISTGHRGHTSAIAAGAQTFAMTLIEALGLLASGERAVLVVLGEEALPPPIDGCARVEPMGVAFALTAERPVAPARTPLGRIEMPRPSTTPLVAPARTSPLASTTPAVALLEALATGDAGTLALVAGATESAVASELWAVDFAPTGAP